MEDRFAHDMGESHSGEGSDKAPHEACERDLNAEEGGDQRPACSDGLHDGDFTAAFHHGGGGEAPDGKAGGEQGGEGDEAHESTDPIEDAAFGIGYTAHGPGLGAGDCFLNFVGDGDDVVGTAPALVFSGSHGFGVLAREVVFGLGEGCDFDAVDITGPVRQSLHADEGDQNPVLIVITG